MLEFIDGNTATVRAAMDAGCGFFAGYPITPATSILLEAVRDIPGRGGVAVQAEDEIAAIGMCLAASMTGLKVMTATSGPGMSLLSETLGLAIMGEVPMVIIDTQRMGPATGGATATADGDVQFARWVTAGGYPLLVLAPADVPSAYTLTRQAFNLAEQFRVPVIVLSSAEIAQTRQTVDLDALAHLPVVDRREYAGPGPYLPYPVTGKGEVPDFSAIGGPHRVRFTTSIHDEHGVVTSDRSRIDRKLRHLDAKIDNDQIDLETLIFTDLEEDAVDLIVAYGAATQAALEAVSTMRAGSHRISLCILYLLWPIPERALGIALAGHKRIVVPEHNFGQYAREIARLAADSEVVPVNRVDGGLISPRQITEALAS